MLLRRAAENDRHRPFRKKRIRFRPHYSPFGKEMQSYRQHEVFTPFQEQGQRYDRPIGQLLYYAYIWRIVFFAVMV